MLEILDNATEIKLIPSLYLKNEELVHTLPLLEEKGIYYEIEKIMPSTETNSIIPLNSDQLDKLDSIIYVSEKQLSPLNSILERINKIEYSYEERPDNVKEFKTNWKVLISTVAFIFIFCLEAMFSAYYGYHSDSFLFSPSPSSFPCGGVFLNGGGGLLGL
jgi:hypothetical protein